MLLLVLGVVLVWLTGAQAQSLFAAGRSVRAEAHAAPMDPAAPVPVIAPGTGPLLQPARALASGGGGPLVPARALALGDREGLAARRSARRSMRGVYSGQAQGYRPPPASALWEEAARLSAAPPKDFAHETALICIAVSIYHEARNQPRAGQAAVASVILTRAANPWRWGGTPCEVVVPVQFSYLTPDRRFARIRDRAAWHEAVEIAAHMLLRGPLPDLAGADHYHATYVDPNWNRSMTQVAQIDDHIFWRAPLEQTAQLGPES